MWLRHIFVGLAVLLCPGVATQAQSGGSISGTVASFIGQNPAGLEVTLTAFSDKVCVDLAAKMERSQIEIDTLAKCRKSNAHMTKTDRDGAFEFRELPAGWYSVAITWPTTGNVPIFPGRESMGGYRVRAYQDEKGMFGLWANSAAFELKAGEEIRKDFAGR